MAPIVVLKKQGGGVGQAGALSVFVPLRRASCYSGPVTEPKTKRNLTLACRYIAEYLSDRLHQRRDGDSFFSFLLGGVYVV